MAREISRATVTRSINNLLSDPEQYADILQPSGDASVVFSIRAHFGWPIAANQLIVLVLRHKARIGQIRLFGARGELRDSFSPQHIRQVVVVPTRPDEPAPGGVGRPTLRYSRVTERQRPQSARGHRAQPEQPEPDDEQPQGPAVQDVLDMIVLHLALTPNFELTSNTLVADLARSLHITGRGSRGLVQDAIDEGLHSGQLDRFPSRGRQITRLLLRELPPAGKIKALMRRYPRIARGRSSPWR